jgi:hypothetical protein
MVSELRPQTFLEHFRVSRPGDRTFFYGLDDYRPFSTLFFHRPAPATPANLGDGPFSFPDVAIRDLQLTPTDRNQTFERQFRRAVFCICESNTRRISTFAIECRLCLRKLTLDSRIDHFLCCHGAFVKEALDLNFEVLDNDEEAFHGFFGKVEFSSLVSFPSKGFPSERRPKPTIPAPLVGPLADTPSLREWRWSVTHRGAPATALTALMNQRAPRAPDPVIDPDFEHTGGEAAFQMTAPILDQYKSRGAAERRKPQTQKNNIAPVRVNHAPAPAPAKQPPPRRELAEIMAAEAPKPKPKPPKYVAYLETIAEPIRNSVVSTLSMRFLRTFVEAQCLQIVRPALQTRRKQHQKKVREAKAARAREEEARRVSEMRQRRQLTIDRLSEEIAQPIVRAFIRAEIAAVFAEEAALVKDEAVVALEATVSETPVVVVSGLQGARQLSVQFLADQFPGYAFALDEDKSPKIRFRSNGSRIDALLYLTRREDVQHLIGQKTILIEHVAPKMTLGSEDELLASSLKSYTGQCLVMSPNARNVEDFVSARGRAAIVEMAPLCALEAFIGAGENGEVK